MNSQIVCIRPVFSTLLEFLTRQAQRIAAPISLALMMSVAWQGALQAQVLGYWQFNEKTAGSLTDTNPGAILDSSGNGYNGTASNLISYVVGSSAYGTTPALEFNLTHNDKIIVPDSTGAFNFTPSQSVTFEALVRTTTSGQSGVGCIVSKVPVSSTAAQWWWRVNAGKLQFLIHDGTTQRSINGITTIADGQWHHVAAVYDGSAQQLRLYVDYVLDTSVAAPFSSAGTIGNSQDLWIGAFQGANNRYFDGDMDFVRISAAALDPTNFVPPATYITDLSPADRAGYVSPTNVASFTVQSPTVGVPAANIHVTLNGTDITSQLVISGPDTAHTVKLPALATNQVYNAEISVTDSLANQISKSWSFNTFISGIFDIEAEDYNFDGGGYIDNPQLSSADGPNNYLDRLGVEGIDYHQTKTPTLVLYRIGDQVGTAVGSDTLRQQYIDAQMTDPGVTDYMVVNNANTEWLNYTRTFPSATYRVYVRLADTGTTPVVMSLDEVTSGSTSATQTLSPIGKFISKPTGSSSIFVDVPLTDATGQVVAVPISGLKTLRLTLAAGTGLMNLNYLVFVPASTTQVPFLTSISPAPDAGNAASNSTIQVSIRNADTTVNTATVQLLLDGSATSPIVSPTANGASVTYTPPTMSIGTHTAILIFADSAATSVTNQWQFYVANQSVFGYWKFNERTNAFASTNAGSILDSSGNARNGTVNGTNMSYVAGSFAYGNSPALRFTTGPDNVALPDSAGNFIFTNSVTFEAIIRTTNSATITGAILAKNGTGDGDGEYWWRLPGAAGGVQRIALGDGFSEYFVAGTNALNDGNWHHVAVVYDAANAQIRLYADYNLETLATNAFFTNSIGRSADLYFGSFIGGGNDLNGDIDSIRISNGALAPAQFIPTSVALPPVVQSVSPANGANNVSPTALIQEVLMNRDTSVVLGSMKLFIDASNVTAGAMIASNGTTVTLSYVPAPPLAAGAHAATVTFQDTAVPANTFTNSWSFTNLATLPVVAFYQFNEKTPGDSASTNAGAIVDSSGNGHNGSIYLTGTATDPVYVMGDTNYGESSALNFIYASTATNIITIPDPNLAFNYTANQSITMEAIIRTSNSSQSGQGCILAKQIANPGEWYWRIASTGLQRFSANNGQNLYTVNSLTSLYDGQWHHIAAVYDGALKQMRVYRDYKLDCTVVSTPLWTSPTALVGNTNEDVWIGAQQSGSSRYDGDIDQIRVTAAALDPSWFIQMGGIGSPVSLLNLGTGGGHFAFSFSTQVNHIYVVQSSPALGPDAVWTDVETIYGDGTIKSVNYTGVNSVQFFRVRTEPEPIRPEVHENDSKCEDK